MAVTDSPDTVIKARDAKRVLDAGDGDRMLAALKGLLVTPVIALGAVQVFRQQREPRVLAAAGNEPDCGVLRDYMHGVARNAAPQFLAADGIVLLAMRADGVIDVATWGVNDSDCQRLGTWGATLLNALPVCPFQTWFGWGNSGVPKAMAADRLAALTEKQRTYVERYTHPSIAG